MGRRRELQLAGPNTVGILVVVVKWRHADSGAFFSQIQPAWFLGRQRRGREPHSLLRTAWISLVLMPMEEYETVRGMPQKGGFGEIFIVRKKKDGPTGPTFVLKRARLAKMSEQEKWRLHSEVSILDTAAIGSHAAPTAPL